MRRLEDNAVIRVKGYQREVVRVFEWEWFGRV